MGLYLCVFSSTETDDEVDGVEVGSYDDFHVLRTCVSNLLEGSRWGSRFPVLMTHPDSEGEWTPSECATLGRELATIQAEFRTIPPKEFAPNTWQHATAKAFGVVPRSLAEWFIDIDGEPLLERLIQLAELAAQRSLSICFQ